MSIEIDPKLLTAKESVDGEKWQTWEKKNFNIHRGVVEWYVDEGFQSIDEIALRIREEIKAQFRPGWFRGFGFGTILHFTEIPADFSNICAHIDTRNKKHGVWQWAVACFDEDKRAFGIHTWLHGYLRPVYDSVLSQLESRGYECESVDADVDKLFVVLGKISRVCKAVKIIGGQIG